MTLYVILVYGHDEEKIPHLPCVPILYDMLTTLGCWREYPNPIEILPQQPYRNVLPSRIDG